MHILVEDTASEIGHFRTFQTSVILTLVRSYGIPSYITHRPLPTYEISFKWEKFFMDRHRDWLH